MGALTIAFDTTIVGALALPWVVLVIHLFFFDGENRISGALKFVNDHQAQAAAGVLLFAMTYTLGSAISRIAQDCFNDDDLHVRIFGVHLLRNVVTEDRILTRVYCESGGESLLPAEKSNFALAEKLQNFGDQKKLCAKAHAPWVRDDANKPVQEDAKKEEDKFVQSAAEILGLQENALMEKGQDYTVRLRQLHDQVMVLRGAAFNGVLGFSLSLFAWEGVIRRKRPGSWVRWAFFTVPVFYFAVGVIATAHHFAQGFPPEPPYIEFILFLLAAVGTWLLLKPQNEMKAVAGEPNEASSKDCLKEEHWLRIVLLSAALTVGAFLGWWSAEVFYAQQVIYSYDTQGIAPSQK